MELTKRPVAWHHRTVAQASWLMTERPWLVVSLLILVAAILWAASFYSIAVQIGGPFPGCFYTPDRIVSSFTPEDFSGWQAGLRPWDRILAVDGQHPSQLPDLVREAGIGGTLTYTVERDGQTLEVMVPAMEFTAGILLRFLPG